MVSARAPDLSGSAPPCPRDWRLSGTIGSLAPQNTPALPLHPQVPDLLVQDELARGELIEVLPSCRSEPMPINLVYSSGRLIPARSASRSSRSKRCANAHSKA